MTVTAVDITEQPVETPKGIAASGSAVWVAIRPNLRRSHSVATDILAALGKRRDLAGKGRNEHQDIALAAAWLAANGAQDLVLVDAQHVGSLILGKLCALAENAGVNLWLLHRPPRTDAFMRAVARRADEEGSLADVPRHATATQAVPHDAEPFPKVPRHDVHLFRAAVEASLDNPDRTRVLAVFDQAANDANTAFATAGATPETIAEVLDDLLTDAPGDDELITRICGLQLAAWHHDVFLRVDLDALLSSEERPTIGVDHIDDALVAYRQPHRIITCALTAHGYPLRDIANLGRENVTADYGTVTIGGKETPVTPIVSQALKVAATLAKTNGGRLIPYEEQTLAAVLTDAAKDLGLQVKGRRAERTRPKHTAHLRRFGLQARALR